jgi:ABC-type oligopeptide transport system ATPase subunit
VLNIMRDLQRKMGLTYLFISHDLAVVRYLSSRIGVMYLGKLVEVGPADEVYLSPAHPYTQGLIDSAPTRRPSSPRPSQVSAGNCPARSGHHRAAGSALAAR